MTTARLLSTEQQESCGVSKSVDALLSINACRGKLAGRCCKGGKKGQQDRDLCSATLSCASLHCRRQGVCVSGALDSLQFRMHRNLHNDGESGFCICVLEGWVGRAPKNSSLALRKQLVNCQGSDKDLNKSPARRRGTAQVFPCFCDVSCAQYFLRTWVPY